MKRGRPKGSTNNFRLSPRLSVEITKLSKQTKISPQQVLEDICDNGLIAVRAMYVGLIESRKAVQQELYEKNSVNGSDEPLVPERAGDSEFEDHEIHQERINGLPSYGLGGNGDTDQQPDPATMRPGQQETFDANPREDPEDPKFWENLDAPQTAQEEEPAHEPDS